LTVITFANAFTAFGAILAEGRSATAAKRVGTARTLSALVTLGIFATFTERVGALVAFGAVAVGGTAATARPVALGA